MVQSNNLILAIMGSLAVGGLTAGASGLLEIARVDERVSHNIERIVLSEEIDRETTVRQMKIKEDVAVVREKVRDIEQEIRRNGDKIDLILDRLPRPGLTTSRP